MNEEQIKEMCDDIYTGGDWEPMIDYITNLQKENERLNNIIDELEESIESSVKVSGLNIKIATEKEIKEKYFYLKHELEMLLLELKKLKEGK